MTDFYETVVPCLSSKHQVWDYAESVASRFGYAPGDDLTVIVDHLGGRIEVVDATEWIGERSETIEVNGPEDFVIYLYNVTSAIRNRFTVAHELGHYFLHADMGRRPIRVGRGESDRVEWEANWFAAAFLMPAWAFREQDRAMEGDLLGLATYFRVSRMAVEIRKKDLGFHV